MPAGTAVVPWACRPGRGGHKVTRRGPDATIDMVGTARWARSAIPVAWRRLLHGWPGYRAEDLARLALSTAGGGHIEAGSPTPEVSDPG